MGNDPVRRDGAETSMFQQGQQAGIKFDYNVLTQWQPVESQRLLLWAGRFGKQEEFMSNLNHRHFEKRESASVRANLLNAVEAVGLDRTAANVFLDTDELEADVWKSYGSTIYEKNIHAIPFFVFNVPQIGAVGGPFRVHGKREPFIVKGSMDEDYFYSLFEKIATSVVGQNGMVKSPLRDDQKHQATVQPKYQAGGCGEKVVLHSLSSESMNGKTGTRGDFDPVKGRYAVTLDDSGKTVSLKPKNIRSVSL